MKSRVQKDTNGLNTIARKIIQCRRYAKRILTAGLSCVMTVSLLAGCGGGMSPDSSEFTDGDGQISDAADAPAMGRYLEKVTDLTTILSGYREKIFALEDGKMVILQMADCMLVSEDNGVTWTEEGSPWLSQLTAYNNIEDYAIGADGTVGIVYSQLPAEDETTDGEENTFQESNDVFYRRTNVRIIRPDGTQLEASLPGQDEVDNYPRHIWISNDGRPFVGTYGAELYEIAGDGSGSVFLTLDDSPQLVQFLGSRMVIDGYGYNSLYLYDMETREQVEDDVLEDFVRKTYGDRGFNGGSWYDLYFFPGEEDVLYLAGEQGLHRHVIGGSAMEQIVDPVLSTFGNPKYKLLSMLAAGDNEFLAVFTDARMVRFTYDPDVPTVPDERIRAYSLTENTMLRQAIAIYQVDHPEVYVEYEIGMEKDSGVTKEDALKKLNTEIMAGEGPDLLILDDLPVDSYIEKGLLKDLTPLAESLNGKLYDNMVNAFRKDGKLYSIPCEASLPTIMCREKYASQVKDLGGIADVMEELRKEHPGQDLLRTCSPKGIMKHFVTSSAPVWLKEDGGIDKEAVREFFTQTKRIYDAQMDGLSEKAILQYEERERENEEYYGIALEDEPYYLYSMDEFNYLMDYRQILIGVLSYSYAYAELDSVRWVKGFEDNVVVPMDGQCSNVFCVQTLAGINASTSDSEHAQGLLSVLLGPRDITSLGFPVNREAFEAGLYPDDYEKYAASGDSYSTLGYMNEDGQTFTWEIYWFDEEEADALRSRMEAADTPYVVNSMLEEAVFKSGIDYMQGELSLDEAVNEVEKRLAIYMAE